MIEKNSITRLSKDYENRLINKIKDNFDMNQQKMFVASFYCFLNYDTKKDFVVDFDNVWKWLGFSCKDPSKRLLEKHFIIDIDYKVENDNKKSFPEVAGKGGNNFEKAAPHIPLLDTFKIKYELIEGDYKYMRKITTLKDVV